MKKAHLCALVDICFLEVFGSFLEVFINCIVVKSFDILIFYLIVFFKRKNAIHIE